MAKRYRKTKAQQYAECVRFWADVAAKDMAAGNRAGASDDLRLARFYLDKAEKSLKRWRDRYPFGRRAS